MESRRHQLNAVSKLHLYANSLVMITGAQKVDCGFDYGVHLTWF